MSPVNLFTVTCHTKWSRSGTRPLSQDCVDFFHCHLAGTALRSCGIYMEFEFFASSTWSTYQNAVEIPFPPTFWLSESQGRCMHIHHSRAQCVKRASWICILRETNRVCGTLFTHTLYTARIVRMHAAQERSISACWHQIGWHRANLGTSRSQAWLRAVNTCIRIVCTPSVCWLTHRWCTQLYVCMSLSCTEPRLALHAYMYNTGCIQRACKQIRHGLCQDKGQCNMRCMHSYVQRRHNETAIGRAR